MNKIFTLMLVILSFAGYGQSDEHISTIDFVEILNGHQAEAMHYYQNNWLVLREMAVEKGYIHSYQLMEVTYSEEAPFHLILVTTYSNQNQYHKREDHFGELIDTRGDLNLLNTLKPGEFRKTVFTKESIREWSAHQ